MKSILLATFSLISVFTFGQKLNFKLSVENFAQRQLVILDLDSVISQQDSLAIAMKWIGGNRFQFEQESNLKRKTWEDESLVFMKAFRVSPDQTVFGLIAGGKTTEGLIKSPSHDMNIVPKLLTYLIIDNDKLGTGFEGTVAMTLCDILLQVTRSNKWEEMLFKTAHNEWMQSYKTALVDLDDIAEVYRHQSELKKIGIDNITFSDVKIFQAGAVSTQGNIGYADRQFFTVKGKEYIATTIYTLGKGLAFYSIEERGPKGEYRFSKAYLEYLFQPTAMKPGIIHEKQNREIKVPQRQ